MKDNLACHQIEVTTARILEKSDIRRGSTTPGSARKVVEVAEDVCFRDCSVCNRLQNVSYTVECGFSPVDKYPTSPRRLIVRLPSLRGIATYQVEMDAGFKIRPFNEWRMRARAGGNQICFACGTIKVCRCLSLDPFFPQPLGKVHRAPHGSVPDDYPPKGRPDGPMRLNQPPRHLASTYDEQGFRVGGREKFCPKS